MKLTRVMTKKGRQKFGGGLCRLGRGAYSGLCRHCLACFVLSSHVSIVSPSLLCPLTLILCDVICPYLLEGFQRNLSQIFIM